MAPMEGTGARRPWLRAWLALGIAAWVSIGVLLVDRANEQGLVQDISISPYHVVGYAALAVLGAYVIVVGFRGLRRGSIRSAFPARYGGTALAFVTIVAWVVLDPIWSDSLGIGGIAGSFGPTRLLIPISLALLALGPIREAIALRREHGLARGEMPIRWAGVLGVGLLGAAITQPGLNPLRSSHASYATNPSADRSEIWVMRPDGSNQTRVLAAMGDGIDWANPVWSPDGDRIAYTQYENANGVPSNLFSDDQKSSIWTAAGDGTDRRPVVEPTDGQAWLPAWSPDGQWIAYSLSPTGAATPAAPAGPAAGEGPGQPVAPAAVPGSVIWISRVDGTDARPVSPEFRDALNPVWSPDGTKLAYIMAAGPGESDVFVSTIGETRLVRDVVVGGGSSNDWGPNWTPDGSAIVYVSNRDGNDEIYIRPSDGSGTPTRLTNDNANDWVPAVSPDGTQIAFVSDRSGEPEVWVMGIDGSNPKNISNNPFGFDGTWALMWSPDGTQIVYAAAAYASAESSGWVREDLYSAQMILLGIALAVLGLLLVALGAPFGSFASVLLIVALFPAIATDDYRYLPAAIAGGLLVDGLVQGVKLRWRLRVGAAGLAGVGTLAFLLTLGAGGTLVWGITLVLGVSLIPALIGYALAELVERLPARSTTPAAPHAAHAGTQHAPPA